MNRRGYETFNRVYHIPTSYMKLKAREPSKRPNRERECLVGERTRIVNRIKSTLARLGIRDFKPTLRGPAPAKAGGGRTSGNRAHSGGHAAAAKHLGRAAA